MSHRIVGLLAVSLLAAPWAVAAPLQLRQDVSAGTIAVYRVGDDEPILTQNAREDYRPYIHPIVAPDGRGELTENGPLGDPHQTGLYWGFTQVNGRDFFQNILIHLSTPPAFSASDKARHRRSGVAGMSTSRAP